MTVADQPDKLVGALASGLAIIRHLGGTPGGLGVSRIARELGLNPSTCFNLLKTLVHEGIVDFDDQTKTYMIGLGLVALAKGSLEQASHARMVRGHLQAIATDHGVTATLWQRSAGERVVLIDRADSDATVQVHMAIGQRLPMYLASLGRCFAAHSGLTRQQLRERFDALRWDDPPSFRAYLASVEQARERGYATDVNHFAKGVTTTSAAVLDRHGNPVMAISAVDFSANIDGARLDALGRELQRRAALVSRAL